MNSLGFLSSVVLLGFPLSLSLACFSLCFLSYVRFLLSIPLYRFLPLSLPRRLRYP